MQTRKKTKNDANGVHGVANERAMEARAMGQQMQVGVEDLAALVPIEIIHEQMQVATMRILLHWFQLILFKSKCKQVLMLVEYLQ
jgi:hypothetical protein